MNERAQLLASGLPADQVDKLLQARSYGTPASRSRASSVDNSMPNDIYDRTQIDSGKSDGSMRTQAITSNVAQQYAGSSGQGTNTADIAGNAMLMSGNPYAMGAGLGLKVLSANQKRKQADREARYKARLAQISNTQSALNNLVNISSRLSI